VVHQIVKAQLQQGGGLPGIDHQIGLALHAQHPRRRELNGSQEQGQKHGRQPEILMPYQRHAAAREQRPLAVAKGSTAPEVRAWCAVVLPARNAEQRVERLTQQQVEDWG
jgi:hypothetical protein